MVVGNLNDDGDGDPADGGRRRGFLFFAEGLEDGIFECVIQCLNKGNAALASGDARGAGLEPGGGRAEIGGPSVCPELAQPRPYEGLLRC